MYSLYKDFSDQKISLAYFGIFSDKITSMLVDLSEGYVSKTDHLGRLSKKASFLIAESFQNIIRHGIIDKEGISELEYNKDFFQITILEDRIVVSSANVLENKHIEKLDKTIDYINLLDRKELKSYQLEQLAHGSISDKGGAGLGLIEMVRKSGLPLQKHFMPLKEGYSLMILNSEIPISRDFNEHKINIEALEKLYIKLVEKNILMLYKGNFSSSSNSNLIEMLENNFIRNNEISSDKAKNIVAIIEVMQNVSKHGKSIEKFKEGIFSICLLNSELYIECSNFIKQENYESLKNTLKTIKLSSIEEIEKLYKKKLAESYLSEDDNGGLGLLEIARFTKNTFTYSFVETPDDEIFYTISIKTI